MNIFSGLSSGCLFAIVLNVNTVAQQHVSEPLTGKLPNGFTYYIQKNNYPSSAIYFRLVVKAGYVQQDKDQPGLAHFVEHMAFRSTTNFPDKSKINYLQNNGVVFGVGFNASANADNTIYTLNINSGNKILLDSSLQIMRDLSHGILFDSLEIEEERGVVIGEIRMKLMNVESRIERKYVPALTNFSRYGISKSFGTIEDIQSFNQAALKRYYNDWYRPDLQALVVVGDIDLKMIENKIRQLFSDITMPAHLKKHESYLSALTGKNQFIVIRDQELDAVEVKVHIKNNMNTVDEKETVYNELLNEVIGKRFEQLMYAYDLPFTEASGSLMPVLVSGTGLQSVNAAVKFSPGK